MTPKPVLKIQGEDTRIDARMLKDERVNGQQQRSTFDVEDTADRLG
jgi:hypothetical protein